MTNILHPKIYNCQGFDVKLMLIKYHHFEYKTSMPNITELPSENEWLGEWLKRLRLADGLSGRKYAKKINISYTTLGNLEHGIPASVDVCKIIADYFKIPQALVLRMNGVIDDDLSTDGSPVIQSTVLAMKVMNTDLQKDVNQYARLKQQSVEDNKRHNKNTQKSGAD